MDVELMDFSAVDVGDFAAKIVEAGKQTLDEFVKCILYSVETVLRRQLWRERHYS